MSILSKHLPFVNEQIAIQTKLAARYADSEWRSARHLSTCEQFKALLADMEQGDRLLDAGPIKPIPRGNMLQLKPEEMEGLPEELLAELSDSARVDKGDVIVLQILADAGGILSLDQILVAFYRKTGEVIKRTTMTSRLYRMTQRGALFGVPDKKGIYSTFRMTEDDAARLLGSETQEPSQPALV